MSSSELLTGSLGALLEISLGALVIRFFVARVTSLSAALVTYSIAIGLALSRGGAFGLDEARPISEALGAMAALALLWLVWKGDLKKAVRHG